MLLAASPLARDSYSATFPPRIFEQKRDCSQFTALALLTFIRYIEVDFKFGLPACVRYSDDFVIRGSFHAFHCYFGRAK